MDEIILRPYTVHRTSEVYSPHDQLPAPSPMTSTYLTRHFYENTAKHLIKDTVRLMYNGLDIDLEKVAALEEVLRVQLKEVEKVFEANSLVQQYLSKRYAKQIKAYREERTTMLREPSYYSKPFNHKDMLHRSYFMKLYVQEQDLTEPKEELLPGIPKWPVKLVKKLSGTRPLLTRLLEGKLSSSHPFVLTTTKELAELKATLYNKSFQAQIAKPKLEYPKFNSGSPKQKQELFAALNIESETLTDSGLPKWDRAEVERIHNETTDEDVKDFTQAMIDYSFAAIVRDNFIIAFYHYTVDGRLQGNYRLLGALSGRFTSNKPNMLNTPSTGSVFSKPIKECFVAHGDFVVGHIDYAGLEDRVIANLSGDENKIGLFTKGYDGHSMASCFYDPETAASITGLRSTDGVITLALELNKLRKLGNQEAEGFRQASKPVSFKLSYGGFPDTHKNGKITQAIFDAYHNDMYPGITKFREEYVLPRLIAEGEIHLGLGFTLKTDDPEGTLRSTNNACSQFWSLLSIIAINKIHQLIDEAGLEEDIFITSNIYDCLYLKIRKNPIIIQWLNANIVPIMETDFIENQVVKNEARLEIGPSWAELTELSEDASLEEITTILNSI